MDKLALQHKWRSAFGIALPAGFLCREALRDRWLRIHSLPASKRYARSLIERQAILARQNIVADFVLGRGSSCVLFITRYGHNKEWLSSETIPLAGRRPVHAMSYHNDCEEEHLEFFAIAAEWAPPEFDDLTLAAADDNSGPIFWANLSTRSAYAPYDGGADLFFSSSATAELARTKFNSWLSPRKDGL